jgi:two-component system sensor histidine kinase BaeS
MWRKSEVFPAHLNPAGDPVQDGFMRTLFTKILLAQVVTVVLALLVVMAITRASLNRGFIEFLERQEGVVLDITAPALAELYQAQGGWEFLRDRPENWLGILRQTRTLLPAGPEHGRRQPRQGRGSGERLSGQPGPGAGAGPPPDHPLRWLRSFDRLQLRERLFLLDANRDFLAGATVHDAAQLALTEIRAGGAVVGFIGFAPMGNVLPPEAERFLLGQVRVLSVALLVALGLAALLGFLLARQLSRPVRELMATVTELTQGQYDRRASIPGRDEIGQLARAVNSLAATLEKNRTARQRWMADIAHELRTPVAILKGEVEALADGVRQPDGRSLSSLGDEINQLAALVDDLQTLALTDAGALDLRRERLDLAALIRQVAEPFTERLTARNIGLELELPATMELRGDAQRLRQLLQNLLENSVRYVTGGGRVRILLGATTEGVLLSVEDSGPGVTDMQLKHLFDRFYRVEQGRSRAGGGSGLGLSICRNIVEAHGGRIRAHRAESGGLAVRIELPA